MAPHFPPDHIPSCPNIGHIGAQVVVNDDRAQLVDANAHLVETNVLGVWLSARCHEQFLNPKRTFSAIHGRSDNSFTPAWCTCVRVSIASPSAISSGCNVKPTSGS